MGCGPLRFLVGAGATAALAGIGFYLTDGYAATQIIDEIIDVEVPEVATEPAAPTEAPASAEMVQDCQAKVTAAINGKTIEFDTGTAVLKAESAPLIDAIGAALAPCAGTMIEVAGHTDTRGDDAANMRLSEQRANTVVQALAAKNVPVSRMVAKGYGETKPAQAGESAAANQANRRIEFAVSAAGAPDAAPAAAPAPATQ